MSSTDYASIAVTSTFLGICFIYVAKEFGFSLKTKCNEYDKDDINNPGAEKTRLRKIINKLFLTHVGSNDLVLFFILLTTAGIVWLATGKYMNALCFILGGITSVIIGLLTILISSRTASKLVNLSHTGFRRLYNRCMGNSSSLVVLSLGLNLLVIFAFSCGLILNEDSSSKVKLALKAITFFSFGNLMVTLYSRISGGLFINAFNILTESQLKDEDQHRPMFDSMNDYLQNIYELILEVNAIVSTLFCGYFMIIGGFSEDGQIVASHFAHINYPVLVLAFSMFVSITFIVIFGFVMKNNSLKLIRRSYLCITGGSLLIVLAFLPLFHFFFTPKDLDPIKYNRFGNYGLVVSGSASAILIALSNRYFLSSYTKPGKSVNLSVFTSLAGGVVNSLSFAKLLCVVPTLTVCINLFICVLVSDVYALLYVAIGFICTLTMVLVGSVFYSLMVASSKLTEYCNYDNDVRSMFSSFKRSWYDINAIIRPFLSTMSILLALVLLSYLSHRLNLHKYSYLHPLVVMSLLIGCLFPVFQSGLILRISCGIANSRLKKSGYSGLVDQLYHDNSDGQDPEHEDNDQNDSFERNKKFLEKLKFWKKKGSDKASDKLEGVSEKGNSATDEKQSESGGQAQADTEEVVVNVHAQTGDSYRTFGRAFKACLLKEAGVREDMLLNAPLMCSSARSTHQDYLTPNLTVNRANEQNSDFENCTNNNVEEMKTDSAESADNTDVYKHGSRDYRILKNADNHYKLFHPKYHDKHFNLRKKSKVASGNLEELQTLLSKEKDMVDETNERAIYCPSYELSDGVNSDIEAEHGDSLDKVYRRSEDIQKDVNRNLNIKYYDQTSCASEYGEKETSSILKLVQNNQIHTKEPDSDTESNNTKGGLNGSDSNEHSKSKEGSAGGKRRFGRRGNRKSKKDKTKSKEASATDSESPSSSPDLISEDSGNSSKDSSRDKEGSEHTSAHETPLSQFEKDSEPESLTDKQNLLYRLQTLDSSSPSASDSPVPEIAQASDPAPDTGDNLTEESESLNNTGYFANEFGIKIQQNLIPPDVNISNQPRRPTPKHIEVPEFKDLEAGVTEKESSIESTIHIVDPKSSSYQNTLRSMLLSIVPLIFSLGFPLLFGITFGKNSITVMVLFSTISSSLLVQLMTFCSMSWESTLLFMKSKRNGNEDVDQQLVNDIDFKNGISMSMIGKITLCSIGPVLNVLVVAIPLVCVLAADKFKHFSNPHGFPSWSDIES